MGYNLMTGEQAKAILLDLCFYHPAIVSEDYGKQDAHHNAEVQCFIYEALEGDPEMQISAHQGWLDGQIE